MCHAAKIQNHLGLKLRSFISFLYGIYPHTFVDSDAKALLWHDPRMPPSKLCLAAGQKKRFPQEAKEGKENTSLLIMN
jgi:hypothetical protein